ncbi:hypothetical protein JX265_010632 [Neoarthrinium moseri]|uniref:Methyltransferase type 11 domain-containing protein n=1 Tax=Neoarthrinium moseri TaxID=1658444 RepID=A0A9P9WDX5_9PEZI|nr:uncharacterized protein JN550_009789 [Neoarthrinium moseri]KAI1846256.1 hypothetical protein JX266_007781 [Neoarthrinium moseri]KAI1859155.1 hypothetical protein JX265_010632 [Neoarthrinium moseri]KAI1863263.1 hypothetical protein JN550_009789 [Neoarthrinium moseri]
MSTSATTNGASLSGSHFQDHAAAYEKFAGSTSSKLAAAALARLPLSTYSADSHILDSACGPGIVTKLLLGPSPPYINVPGLPLKSPPRVTGIDYAPAMVEQFVARTKAMGLTTTSAFVHDAGDLSCFPDASFDAVVMNLGIFVLPDPVHAAAEMLRVLKPGGHVAVTTWKHAGGHVLLQKVVDAIRPGKQERAVVLDSEWKTKEKLSSVMKAGGFGADDMEIWAEDVGWTADSLEDVVEFMSSSMWTQRIWKDWSEEEKARWGSEMVNQMSEEERESHSISMVGWVYVCKKGVE